MVRVKPLTPAYRPLFRSFFYGGGWRMIGVTGLSKTPNTYLFLTKSKHPLWWWVVNVRC